MKEENQGILMLILFVVLFLYVGYVYTNNNKEVSYETKQVCKVLKSKHYENESTNLRGDFIVVYYFLYDDGTLEKVKLRDYMMFNVTDTVCWEIKKYQ